MDLLCARYESPAGGLVIGSLGERVCLCDWCCNRYLDSNMRRIEEKAGCRFHYGESSVIRRAMEELEEYFAGRRSGFSTPLLPIGTDFQMRVWQELQDIPYGATISYAELARRVGNEKAVRAVAGANSRNCISILIPCHRVIASDGGVGGYAGGVEAKGLLLALEKMATDKNRCVMKT
ncbi:MAG: methylated-DNA--[protein]-cysteine S-methyltransferase [Firmicutes bacterium]|nr:methylated-DNA--[protein]-cysteine S-methyltransferase [Bacillota bacterium]MCM1402096.1 methylated-DNA--[protein]-cysteine S-methyltransferase [Bacteroides sp.]MCM1476545.1 methylated-DNA--[protein]-cysteine S-methyltransferase [Bacteroides sp.]